MVLYRAIVDAFAAPGKDGTTVREALEAQQWLAVGGHWLAFACEGGDIDVGMIKSWAGDMAAKGWPRHQYEMWKMIARELKR